MNDRELAAWLVEKGGPAIRYRAATELLSEPDSVDVDRRRKELLESRLVELWLGRLVPDTSPTGLHHSKNTAYENAMGKLTQLGCTMRMSAFDQRTLPFRRWLQNEVQTPKQFFGPFYWTLLASLLAMAGYGEDEAVKKVLTRRLETLYELTHRGSYDLYVDQDTYPGFPKAFRNHPLINSKLYEEGNLQLPWIHDLNGLANSPDLPYDERYANKIDTIVSYILHPEYQKLPQGYGILYVPKRHYYAMGWDVKLPGYFGLDLSSWDARCFVQRVELMAHFRAAREHPWFAESLNHLEAYRTRQGNYLFPRRYLQERPSGYWVTGAYMGLEENRRSELAIELESTFWMLRIKKTMEQ